MDERSEFSYRFDEVFNREVPFSFGRGDDPKPLIPADISSSRVLDLVSEFYRFWGSFTEFVAVYNRTCSGGERLFGLLESVMHSDEDDLYTKALAASILKSLEVSYALLASSVVGLSRYFRELGGMFDAMEIDPVVRDSLRERALFQKLRVMHDAMARVIRGEGLRDV